RNSGDARGPGATPLTYRQVFERITAVLDGTLLVIPDTFLGVFSASDLPVKRRAAFLCSAVWASIGHSVVAAVGASFGSARWPLVIDGRFSHDRDGALHHGAIPLQSDRCRPRQRHLWFRAVFARCPVLQ